jgi:hypothetical protein
LAPRPIDLSARGAGHATYSINVVFQTITKAASPFSGTKLPYRDIHKAKTSSFDAACYIDVQLVCGAGFEAAEAFLRISSDPVAKALLALLQDSKYAGDFEGLYTATAARFLSTPLRAVLLKDRPCLVLA